jgi:hypothetical protein
LEAFFLFPSSGRISFVAGSRKARRTVQNAPDLLPKYEATVGSFLKILQGLEGRADGDPRKIADEYCATGE